MDLNRLGREIAGELEYIIEDVVRRHDDRSALGEMELMICKRLMANRYRNDEFEPLVSTIIDNLSLYEDTVLRGGYIEDRLHDNILDIYETYLCMVVSKNRGLDKLSDHEYEMCMRLIESPIADFLSGRSHRGRPSDRGYGAPDRGHYRDDRGYQDTRYEPRSNRYMEPERDYAPSRGGYASPSRPQEDPRRSVSEDDVYNVMFRARQKEREEVQHEPRSRHENTHREPEPVSHREVHTETPTRSSKYVNTTGIEGPNHMAIDPYGDFWLEDKHYQVAYKSDWKLSGTGVEAMPILTNIYTEILYFVKDENENVTQEVFPVTDQNRYLNQQLFDNPLSASEASYWSQRIRSGQKNVDDFDTSEPETEVEVTGSDKVTLGEIFKELHPDELTEVGKPMLCDNTGLAVLETRSKLSDTCKINIDTFQVRDPIEFENKEQAEFVKKLVFVPTMAGIADLLKQNPTNIPPAPMHKLCSKISDYIIDMTVHEFGMPLTQMRFPDHWDKLLDWLLKTKKQEWVMEYTKCLNSRIVGLLSTAVMTDDEGNPLEAFNDIITDWNKGRVVGFVEHVGIVAIDKLVDDLTIGKQLDRYPTVSISPLTSGKESNVIHTRLRAIGKRVPNDPISKFLIATRDGRLIRIRPSDKINGHLVLNLITIK